VAASELEVEVEAAAVCALRSARLCCSSARADNSLLLSLPRAMDLVRSAATLPRDRPTDSKPYIRLGEVR
jgi:hypothetical protein